MAVKKNKKMEGKNWKTIGIIGTGPCVGVTHFCIMLANYLWGVRRQKTAVLEWNTNGDFSTLEEICTGRSSKKKPFQILGVTYFSCITDEEAVWCLSQDYDKLVIDFGWDCSHMLDLLRCEKKAVISSVSEWQIKAALDFFASVQDRTDKSWKYYTAFGSEEARRELKKTYRIPLQRIPFSEDAFSVTGETLPFFSDLL